VITSLVFVRHPCLLFYSEDVGASPCYPLELFIGVIKK